MSYWKRKNKKSYLSVDLSDTKTYKRDLMDQDVANKVPEYC